MQAAGAFPVAGFDDLTLRRPLLDFGRAELRDCLTRQRPCLAGRPDERRRRASTG